MANLQKIHMDGVDYRVGIVYGSMEEAAELVDGPNAGVMLSGFEDRDLTGTYYGHSMSVEPDPRYPQDYDALYDALAAPVNSHSVTMPHGQSTVTYDAKVSSVRRRSGSVMGGVRRWHGIEVSFRSIRPVRAPGETAT